MRREDINQDLRNLAFAFFYWFSRFEFALKEQRFLKNGTIGARAEPDWDKFVKAHRAAYALSPAAAALLAEKPRRQIVGDPEHGFEDLPFPLNTAASTRWLPMPIPFGTTSSMLASMDTISGTTPIGCAAF